MGIFPRAGRAQLKDGQIIPRKREYKTYEQSQIARHIKQQSHQSNVSKLNPIEFYPEPILPLEFQTENSSLEFQ